MKTDEQIAHMEIRWWPVIGEATQGEILAALAAARQDERIKFGLLDIPLRVERIRGHRIYPTLPYEITREIERIHAALKEGRE